jgi:hypothetical protein
MAANALWNVNASFSSRANACGCQSAIQQANCHLVLGYWFHQPAQAGLTATLNVGGKSMSGSAKPRKAALAAMACLSWHFSSNSGYLPKERRRQGCCRNDGTTQLSFSPLIETRSKLNSYHHLVWTRCHLCLHACVEARQSQRAARDPHTPLCLHIRHQGLMVHFRRRLHLWVHCLRKHG